MFMLERQEPKPIKAIGNTCTYGDISYQWKQVAMSEDKEALKNLIIPQCKYRIITWPGLDVVYKNF